MVQLYIKGPIKVPPSSLKGCSQGKDRLFLSISRKREITLLALSVVQICSTAGTGHPPVVTLAVTAVLSFPCLFPNGPASSFHLMLAQAFV